MKFHIHMLRNEQERNTFEYEKMRSETVHITFLIALGTSWIVQFLNGQTIDEILDKTNFGTHAEELDIAIASTPHRRKRAAVAGEQSLWRDKTVPYHIDGTKFNASEVFEVRNAVLDWARYTCLNFQDIGRAVNGNYINFTSIPNGGCTSPVGRNLLNRPNDISLENSSCRRKHIVLHMIGHSLGLWHEHNRPDRDRFVEVRWNEIRPGQSNFFQKIPDNQVNSRNIPYDYLSIMHYGKSYLAKTVGATTLQTVDPSYLNIIGTVRKLSFRDIEIVNLMYNCSENCPALNCPGEGFVSKNCNCWCPNDTNVYERCSGQSRPVAECSDPGTPLNGRRTATTFVAASVVTFACNVGFQLRGAVSITCQPNGQWSSATPTCEPAGLCPFPVLLNGLIQGAPPFDVGSQLQFNCSQEFLLHGSPSSSCVEGPSGLQWQPELPTCQQDNRRRSSLPALCPTPILTNGEIQGVAPFHVGSRIQFRCNQGYQLNGANSVSCAEVRGDPQWQPEPPTCLQGEVPSCSVPTLTNGLIQDVPPFLLGSQIQFSCLEDYQLIGASLSTCVETMDSPQWQPPIPTCERAISCPVPSLLNGLIEGSAPHDVSSQIRFTCNEGYTLNGASSSFCVTTDSGAMWQPQIPICEPDDGNESCEDDILFCADYSLQCDDPNTFLMCRKSCNGCHTDPSCVVPSLTNGAIEGATSYPIGTEIRFRCLEGYQLNGASSSTCARDANGIRWQPPPPNCIQGLSLCAEVILANGRTEGARTFSVDSQIQFNCDEGYSLNGTSSAFCVSINGILQWQPPPPTCEQDGGAISCQDEESFCPDFSDQCQDPSVSRLCRRTCNTCSGVVMQCDFESGFCGFVFLSNRTLSPWKLSRSTSSGSDQVASVNQRNSLIRAHMQIPNINPTSLREHCLKLRIFISEPQQGRILIRDQDYILLWSSENVTSSRTWRNVSVIIPELVSSLFVVAVNYDTANGNISIDDVELKEEACPAEGSCNSPDNRKSYPAGSVIHFQCNSGSELQGSSFTRCLPNGEWSHSLPDCVEASLSCDFETNLCGFTPLSTGGTMWGLSDDRSFGPSRHVYVDQERYTYRSTLQSPSFSIGGYCLHFSVFLSPADSGRLDVSDQFFDVIWTSRSDPRFTGGKWNNISVDLGSSVSQFNFVSLGIVQIAIDDVRLISGSCNQDDNFGEDTDVICNDRNACQREYGTQRVQYIPLLRFRECCLRPLRQQGIVPS